jgi:hypothetical protein
MQRVEVEGELGALERKAEDGRRGRAQVKQHDAAVLERERLVRARRKRRPR